MFEPAWSTRTAEDDPGAPFFNETPKYVVTSTLDDPTWENSTILGPYAADTIRDVQGRNRRRHLRERQHRARARDARRRTRDELHLFVFPVALGRGQAPVRGRAERQARARRTRPYDNGVVHLGYGPAAELKRRRPQRVSIASSIPSATSTAPSMRSIRRRTATRRSSGRARSASRTMPRHQPCRASPESSRA